jgi:hypothetical protein
MVALLMYDFGAFAKELKMKNAGLFRLQSRASPFAAITDSIHRVIADPSHVVAFRQVRNYDEQETTEQTLRMSIIEN